ncbi:MAG TPA: FKBP-type peptidyl-prolyl cis-trans isomerase [Chitinophagaceae bacterium]|nr:FKBP-type peptidyl-prolyl cis-trans isomerase [Chitinophagaceae bacterium]
MKKILLTCFALFLFFVFNSCRKRDNGCALELDPAIKAPDSEIVRLQNYITSNNITATQHPSGIFYDIITQGSGNVPGQCTQVGVTYVGTLSSGVEFDRSNTTVFYQLGGFIYGWRIGLPLIKKGGKMKLYVPPALGYGQTDIMNNNGVVVIPKNSILVFEVNLNEVN